MDQGGIMSCRGVWCLLVLLSTCFTGCAIGPLVNQETARTVGQGKNELMGGYGLAGYVVKWNYGITPDLDLGLHWESFSAGFRTKYAFINEQKEGFSLAGGLGAGFSYGGQYYYGDLTGSYLVGKWEPYGTLRFVHVTTDAINFNDKNRGQVSFIFDRTEYDYGDVLLGLRYWVNPRWVVSVEGSYLLSFYSDLKIGNSIIAGVALGCRF